MTFTNIECSKEFADLFDSSISALITGDDAGMTIGSFYLRYRQYCSFYY